MIFDPMALHLYFCYLLQGVFSFVGSIRPRLCTRALLLLSVLVGGKAMALSFSGPEVLKLDWNTRSLNVSDMNNDGLNDLIIINNDTAKIELLYQLAEGTDSTTSKKQLDRNQWEPELEDARFENEAITVGFSLFDLVVGDLNGDNRIDLAYTGREVPLTVRFQGDSGDWTESEEFDGFEALGWSGTLEIMDLDHDGNAELVAISADGLRIFEQGNNGQLHEREIYSVTGQNTFNLMVADVTNDNLPDISYISSDGKQSLVLREQSKDGGFGPELHFSLDRPVRSIRVLPHADDTTSFCAVDSRSGSLEFFKLQRKPVSEKRVSLLTAQPEVYPIFKKGRLSASYAFGDMNGDSLADLLVANPDKAEVVFFPGAPGSFDSPETFPSFSEISSMARGRFFEGVQDVIFVSAGERMMGLSRMGHEKRLEFPKQLTIGDGDPLVCQAVNLDGDDYDELVFVSETDETMTLRLARPADREDIKSEWIELSRIDLKGVKRKPKAIQQVAIFEDNQPGLMVFVPREAPLFFTMDSSDTPQLKEIASTSNIRESLLKDIQPTQVSVIDVNDDGINELVVGQDGYARAIRVNGEALEMVDQFNARRSDDTVSAVIPFYDHDKVDQLVFYVEELGEFQLIEQDTDGVFRYDSSIDVGKIELSDWYRFSNSRDVETFIFAGTDRFWTLTNGSDVWSRVVEQNYETHLEDVFYNFLEGADFNGDGTLELIAVDGQNHVVEILSEQDEGLESQMFWEIFEQNLHYQGRNGSSTEPRETVIADVTNDGKLDFAFLVHDRILFYLQQ